MVLHPPCRVTCNCKRLFILKKTVPAARHTFFEAMLLQPDIFTLRNKQVPQSRNIFLVCFPLSFEPLGRFRVHGVVPLCRSGVLRTLGPLTRSRVLAILDKLAVSRRSRTL